MPVLPQCDRPVCRTSFFYRVNQRISHIGREFFCQIDIMITQHIFFSTIVDLLKTIQVGRYSLWGMNGMKYKMQPIYVLRLIIHTLHKYHTLKSEINIGGKLIHF